MSKTSVKNIKGEEIKDITLNKDIWGITPNDTVLHDALILTNASLRQGTHSTKTRGEVRGGGKKPWRQKGTGRARQGSNRSPQWPGGGIVFGPKPRSYSKKMNRKERRLALKSALSYKVINNELFVIDNFDVSSYKTKEIKTILDNLQVTKKTLIVVEDLTDNQILATRNLRNIILLTANEINTYDVINCDKMIITENAVKLLEEVLN